MLWGAMGCLLEGGRRGIAPFAAACGVALFGVIVTPAITAAAPGDWTLTKTPSPTTYTGAGQTITYTYSIKNNTSSDGSITSLVDSKLGNITSSCPSLSVPNSATVTCTFVYVTTPVDVAGGNILNNATVSGDSCNEGCLTSSPASATVTFVPQPSWTLSKTPSPTTYTAANQTINYSYLLRNTGNVTITAISISDNKVSPVTCPSSALAAGASMTCTGTYATTGADVS